MREDSEIVELYWARSEDALSATAERYGGYCHTVAYNILGDHRDAEECVNDAFLRAWNAIPPHRPKRLSAFLGKLTRNLAINRCRAYRTEKRGGARWSWCSLSWRTASRRRTPWTGRWRNGR